MLPPNTYASTIRFTETEPEKHISEKNPRLAQSLIFKSNIFVKECLNLDY